MFISRERESERETFSLQLSSIALLLLFQASKISLLKSYRNCISIFVRRARVVYVFLALTLSRIA